MNKLKACRVSALVVAVGLLGFGAPAVADDSAAIIAATQSYYLQYIYTSVNFTNVSVVESSPYAIITAQNGVQVFSAFVEQTSGNWQVAQPGKGSFSISLLEQLGVPYYTAARLLNVSCPAEPRYNGPGAYARTIRKFKAVYRSVIPSRMLRVGKGRHAYFAHVNRVYTTVCLE